MENKCVKVKNIQEVFNLKEMRDKIMEIISIEYPKIKNLNLSKFVFATNVLMAVILEYSDQSIEKLEDKKKFAVSLASLLIKNYEEREIKK